MFSGVNGETEGSLVFGPLFFEFSVENTYTTIALY
jgi:hypothetical protein